MGAAAASSAAFSWAGVKVGVILVLVLVFGSEAAAAEMGEVNDPLLSGTLYAITV